MFMFTFMFRFSYLCSLDFLCDNTEDIIIRVLKLAVDRKFACAEVGNCTRPRRSTINEEIKEID